MPHLHSKLLFLLPLVVFTCCTQSVPLVMPISEDDIGVLRGNETTPVDQTPAEGPLNGPEKLLVRKTSSVPPEGASSVQGESCRKFFLGIFPLSAPPTLQSALEQAYDEAGDRKLHNVSAKETWWTALLISEECYVIEASVDLSSLNEAKLLSDVTQ